MSTDSSWCMFVVVFGDWSGMDIRQQLSVQVTHSLGEINHDFNNVSVTRATQRMYSKPSVEI